MPLRPRIEPSGNLRDGRHLLEKIDGQLNPEPVFEDDADGDGQEGIAAQLEKVLTALYRPDAEHLLESFRHNGFGWRQSEYPVGWGGLPSSARL